MRILGIDPGYATIGWGAVQFEHARYTALDYGAIITSPDLPFPHRLQQIYEQMLQCIDQTQPDAVSIEKLFFYNNKTTGIDVAQARGVIVLAAQQRGVPIFEYTPMQVKTVVTGYGQAHKPQVMEMTRRLLRLESTPKPDDTADALALAICHGQLGGLAHSRRQFSKGV